MFPTIPIPEAGVSLQWIYERVRDHLLKQGVRSFKENNEPGDVASGCLYRGPNNTACAAGCLIADPHYSVGLEGWPVLNGVVEEALVLSIGSDAQLYIKEIRALQQIHDDKEPDVWQHELEQFAMTRGLNP